MTPDKQAREALERLLTYGNKFHDGYNWGYLFRFDSGAKFFLSNQDVAALRTAEATEPVACYECNGPLHGPYCPACASPSPVTDDMVERAARIITEWLGYSWEGIEDGSVEDKGFPVFTNSQFGWVFQGRKGDMQRLAHRILAALEPAEEGR
jgi:hypothetical protein